MGTVVKLIPTTKDKPAPKKETVLEKKQVDKIDLAFGRLQKKIKKFKKQGNDSQVDVSTLKYLLNMTVDLIPLARKTYEKYPNERAIYALNGLVNQARELMNDLRQQQTGKKQLEYINVKILMPSLQLIMQHYMTDCAEYKKMLLRLDKKISDKFISVFEDLMRRHAQYFDVINMQMQENLKKYLMG